MNHLVFLNHPVAEGVYTKEKRSYAKRTDFALFRIVTDSQENLPFCLLAFYWWDRRGFERVPSKEEKGSFPFAQVPRGKAGTRTSQIGGRGDDLKTPKVCYEKLIKTFLNGAYYAKKGTDSISEVKNGCFWSHFCAILILKSPATQAVLCFSLLSPPFLLAWAVAAKPSYPAALPSASRLLKFLAYGLPPFWNLSGRWTTLLLVIYLGRGNKITVVHLPFYFRMGCDPPSLMIPS